MLTRFQETSGAGAESGEQTNFILRVSRNTPSLHPYQVLHEVACLEYLTKNVPEIPAPKVYRWDCASSAGGPPFIAEEFIDGKRLSVAWPRLSEEQKTSIIREVAEVIAALGETRFTSIGGLSMNGSGGPTIEAAKVLNGRAKFHSQANYDIGPYRDSKAYILACHDREICYYTQATESEIAETGLEASPASIADLVAKLQTERETLCKSFTDFNAIDAEPLVLVHDDLHSGNLLVRDGHLVGVLDWEFSGVYPLSELLGRIAILQVSEGCRDEMTEEEEDKWHQRYRAEVERVVRERGWREEDIKTVMGEGHRLLHTARSIMLPEYEGDQLEE